MFRRISGVIHALLISQGYGGGNGGQRSAVDFATKIILRGSTKRPFLFINPVAPQWVQGGFGETLQRICALWRVVVLLFNRL